MGLTSYQVKGSPEWYQIQITGTASDKKKLQPCRSYQSEDTCKYSVKMTLQWWLDKDHKDGGLGGNRKGREGNNLRLIPELCFLLSDKCLCKARISLLSSVESIICVLFSSVESICVFDLPVMTSSLVTIKSHPLFIPVFAWCTNTSQNTNHVPLLCSYFMQILIMYILLNYSVMCCIYTFYELWDL